MELRKKGVFFTMAAIALAVILMLSIKSIDTAHYAKDAEVISVRIDTMNNFVKDVELDLEKGLYIASFRAIASMADYIASNGTFIADVDSSAEELILFGTFQTETATLMVGSTFTNWTKKIEDLAGDIAISMNFTINSVTLTQEDPWEVLVTASVSYTAIDAKNTSSWVRNKDIQSKVSILNFEDPFYSVNSLGRIGNPIQEANTTIFVIQDNVTSLMYHVNRSYYITTNLSPNFLMRLQGDLSASAQGIESLVNVQEFIDEGFAPLDRSIVDFLYFGSQVTTNHRINNTPAWVKIDDEHLAIYQVENITI